MVAGAGAQVRDHSPPARSGPAPAEASLATVSVSLTGDDATCRRGAGRACRTFQRAYDLAQAGDTVSVQAGSYPANDPARDSVTIFGPPKAGSAPVTFTCAGGTVEVAAHWFTIKAHNVTVSGTCFRLHVVRVGEPGDTDLSASNVLVEGVHMDGIEIPGADRVTIRNSEIGPNVMCYAPGKTGNGSNGGPITAAMWCDPNGAPYEAFYAQTGGTDRLLGFQPYIHNNSGRAATGIVLEGNYIHDIQTKDAFNLHTGCGLIWNVGPQNAGNIVLRGNRYENCAVLGVLFDHTDGVTIENNWFGNVTEPLSNGQGDDYPAPRVQPMISFKAFPDDVVANVLIRFNSLDYRLDLRPGAFSNVRVLGNILGEQSYCPAGALFDSNVFIASVGCGTKNVQVASPPYVRVQAPIDFHLAGTGPPVDLVSSDDGSDYILEYDFDGQGRPMGARRDAGADERQ